MCIKAGSKQINVHGLTVLTDAEHPLVKVQSIFGDECHGDIDAHRASDDAMIGQHSKGTTVFGADTEKFKREWSNRRLVSQSQYAVLLCPGFHIPKVDRSGADADCQGK
jgi:hypothetical protein